MSIVVVKGHMFLGYNGKLVAEFPDAQLFEYEDALKEAEKIEGCIIHNYGTDSEYAEDF